MVVRVLHRIADTRKKVQTAVDIEAMIAAIDIDAEPGNMLHHKEWQPRLGSAAIQNPRDIRVVESR